MGLHAHRTVKFWGSTPKYISPQRETSRQPHKVTPSSSIFEKGLKRKLTHSFSSIYYIHQGVMFCLSEYFITSSKEVMFWLSEYLYLLFGALWRPLWAEICTHGMSYFFQFFFLRQNMQPLFPISWGRIYSHLLQHMNHLTRTRNTDRPTNSRPLTWEWGGGGAGGNICQEAACLASIYLPHSRKFRDNASAI